MNIIKTQIIYYISFYIGSLVDNKKPQWKLSLLVVAYAVIINPYPGEHIIRVGN